MRVLFAGLVAWTLLSTVYTRMADSDAAKFYECYKNREINFNISIATINEVMSDPCQQYATEATFDLLTNYNISMDDVNWLRSLDREARGVLGYKVKRWKRQAVRLRQRRDCRALSPRERRRLFRAIRLLKFRSRQYDALAALHAGGDAFQNAHRGSNFPGWHRVFLFYYELALMRRGARALCYWDSSCDFSLPGNGQLRTSTFSNRMFGNLDGVVFTGPFRNWPIPGQGNLRRGMQPPGTPRGGSLARPGVVDLIRNDPRIITHRQILTGQGSIGFTDPDNGGRHSMEQEHDVTHVWVGGVMGAVPVAPQDPVFYFHHCYIDYIWEGFRQKMRSRGRNPEAYPTTGDGNFHAGRRQMSGLSDIHPWWSNRNGYTDLFTERAYTYAAAPICGNDCDRAQRNMLRCPPRGEPTDRCVPIIIQDDDVPPGQFAGRSVQLGGRAAKMEIETEGRNRAMSEGPREYPGPHFVARYRDMRAVY